jgi:DNA-binding transcriptional LysR family regulator
MFEELLARRGLSLERLHSFLLVAEAGGIARAVGGDPVRQSQFSRQIGELEEYFGTQLTRRRGKTLALTDTGHKLAAAVRAQMQGLEDFRRECLQQPADLALGAGDSLLTWVVIPRLAELQRSLPRTRLRVFNLRSSEIGRRLGDFRLDFGLARASIIRPPLRSVNVGRVEYRLFVPHKLLRKHQGLTGHELAARLPVATLGSDGEFFTQLVEGARDLRVALNIRLVTESFPQAAVAVQSGEYAGILPLHATTALPADKFAALQVPFLQKAGRTVVLGWNPRFLRVRTGAEEAVRCLRELLAIPAPAKPTENK